MSSPPRILAIAGSDSSGGAGIQADIKTITMLGGYAMGAITAVTAQNTLGLQAIEALSPQLVAAQIDACLSDIGADAVKIGMLGSPEVAAVVADRLKDLTIPIVFDPVMVSTSGAALADARTIAASGELLKLAMLATPNLPETEALGGEQAIAALGCAVLVTGGDAAGNTIIDRLFTTQGEVARWESPRIATRHTHGTGCTLSSAIATLLGKGLPLERAIADAREFVREALLKAPGFGAGHGPLGHQAVR